MRRPRVRRARNVFTAGEVALDGADADDDGASTAVRRRARPRASPTRSSGSTTTCSPRTRATSPRSPAADAAGPCSRPDGEHRLHLRQLRRAGAGRRRPLPRRPQRRQGRRVRGCRGRRPPRHRLRLHRLRARRRRPGLPLRRRVAAPAAPGAADRRRPRGAARPAAPAACSSPATRTTGRLSIFSRSTPAGWLPRGHHVTCDPWQATPDTEVRREA